MKILSILANGTGSAYYRQFVPMAAVAATGKPVFLSDGGNVPEGLIGRGDVIQISRVSGANYGPVIDHIKTCQAEGVRVVIDYDDDLLNIPPHNPAHGATTPEAVIDAVQAADAIVVTTEALATVYRPYARQIGIIPNFMDVARWPRREPRGDRVTLGLVGSASHHEDWKLIAEPMRRIREEFDVDFLVAGYLPDYLADLVSEFVRWQDVAAYQRTVNRIDIGLCPLLPDDFNRRKTPIKALEYGLAGAAVVASPTLYAPVVQGRGSLARSEDDWYKAIRLYIQDAQKRKADAQALKAHILAKWDVRKYVGFIYNTYRRLAR